MPSKKKRNKKFYLGCFFPKCKKLQRKLSHDPSHMGDTFAYQFTVVNNAFSRLRWVTTNQQVLGQQTATKIVIIFRSAIVPRSIFSGNFLAKCKRSDATDWGLVKQLAASGAECFVLLQLIFGSFTLEELCKFSETTIT